MNKTKKAIIICSIIVVVLIVAFPLLIHILFSNKAPNDFWSAKWEAGDMLQYIGTIISAVIAIIGIGVTIRYTQKQYHDDVVNGVLPYLSIEVLKQDVDDIDESDSHYFSLVYVIVHTDKIEIKTKMDNDLHEILRKTKPYNVNIGAGKAIMAPQNLKILFDVFNLGKGPAISFTVSAKASQQIDIEGCSIPINILQKERFPICMVIEDYKNNPNMDYNIMYEFNDIYGTPYNQIQKVKKVGEEYLTGSVLSQPKEKEHRCKL